MRRLIYLGAAGFVLVVGGSLSAQFWMVAAGGIAVGFALGCHRGIEAGIEVALRRLGPGLAINDNDRKRATVGNVNIYVLPTEERKPPRALLFELPQDVTPEVAAAVASIDDPDDADAVARVLMVPGQLAVWSSDAGTWMVAGVPLDQALSEAITEHAKSLGVEW